MPISYTIDTERRVVLARAEGRLVDADLLDYARRLLADPDRKQAKHELADLRDVTEGSSVSTEGLRQLVDFWRAAYDEMTGGKLAIIASDDLPYGLARMYEGLRADGPDSIRVFRDERSAWAWLEEDG